MTASSLPGDQPVQLTLELIGRSSRAVRTPSRASPPRPFWDVVDLVDVGGPTLRACGRAVRVRLDVDQTAPGDWIAHHDLVLAASGTSAPTRRQLTRGDALGSAAHAVARHCRSILLNPERQRREDLRSAKEVIRWLESLDLL
jgi:hypothetical protein